jgi:hypothetical protein
MNYIAVPIDLIYDTPNDMELGAKVRELYFELQDESPNKNINHEN